MIMERKVKLVFAVDGKVIYDRQGNKYARSFQGLYEKYSYLADEISFLVRTEQRDDLITDNYLQEEINIIDVPNFKSISTIWNTIKAKRVIESGIKNADIVILRMPGSISNIAIKYVKRYSKPYIIECVGCPWDAYRHHSLLGKIVAPIEYIKMKNNIRKASYVTYVTKDFLQKRYPTNGMSSGISDVELLKADAKVLLNRLDKISCLKDEIILGTAGTVEIPYKGQEYVLRAIAMLKKEGVNRFKYELVGGGDPTRLKNLALELGIEDMVVFLGGIPHSDMFSWFDRIDIYIQPSTVEGLPRSIIEAMSRACPVVGSRIGGIPELISDKYLFEAGNVQELKKILLTVSNNELDIMAKVNFDKAKEYERDSLEKQRRFFYDMFISNVRGV